MIKGYLLVNSLHNGLAALVAGDGPLAIRIADRLIKNSETPELGWFLKGQSSFINNDNERAEQCADQALLLSRTCQEALLLKIEIALAKGDKREAEQFAKELHGIDQSALSKSAALLTAKVLGTAASDRLAGTQPTGAHPGNVKEVVRAARSALRRKDYQTAFRFINAAVAVNPSSASLLVIKANCARLMGDQEALRSTVVALSQFSPTDAASLALPLMQQGDPLFAAKVVLRGARASGEKPDPKLSSKLLAKLRTASAVAQRDADFAMVCRCIQAMNDISPNDANEKKLLTMRGRLLSAAFEHVRAGNAVAAVQGLGEILTLFPNHDRSLRELALQEEKLENWREAALHWRHLASVNPADAARSLRRASRASGKADDPMGALEAYDALARVAPSPVVSQGQDSRVQQLCRSVLDASSAEELVATRGFVAALASRDHAVAPRAVKKWVGQATRLLSSRHISRELEQATEIAATIARVSSASSAVLLRVATELIAQGRYGDATPLLERVTETHGPQRPPRRAWARLGLCYLKNKALPRAQYAFQRALEEDPADAATAARAARLEQQMKAIPA